MTPFFYQFLLHPLDTLDRNLDPPSWAIFLMALLIGIQIALPLNPFFFGPLFALLFGGLILCQAWVLDFTAQLWQKQGQSKRLFKWLILSWYPSLAVFMLHLLPFSKLHLAFLHPILSLSALIAVVYLQVKITQSLYKLSSKESLLVYFLPLVVPIGIIGLFLILGMVYGIFFLRGLA